MAEGAIDPRELARQYGTAERLEIRVETHARYSERSNVDFHDWVLDHLELRTGATVLDVGCGSGGYHARLAARVIGIDPSRGMLETAGERARAAGLPVRLLRCGAERLALRSSSCDGVAANHVLYHVPDRDAALREMRRVLVPGGRVVLATNAADFGRELWELHEAAVRALGLEWDDSVASRFTLDDLERVRSTFPDARVERLENAFLFPDVEAALRYYASGLVDAVAGDAEDGRHRPALLERVADGIRAVIEREGTFRVSKTTGCFFASR